MTRRRDRVDSWLDRGRRLRSRLALPRPVSLAVSLVLLGVSVLLLADMLGLRGNPREQIVDSRKLVAESLAMHLSTLAGLGDEVGIARSMQGFADAHPSIVAASLVRADGSVIGRHGDRAALEGQGDGSTFDRLRVPIFTRTVAWGEVRLAFRPSAVARDDAVWLGMVAIGFFISFVLFLMRVLVQLDPGRAVPGRVDSALNLFSAGVVILDDRLRIVLVNRAAETMTGKPSRLLVGRTLDDWDWDMGKAWQAPWSTTLHSGVTVSDTPLRLRGPDGDSRLFAVSCAFVGQETGNVHGVMVTLDDLTPVEQKNRELARTLAALQRSRDELIERTEALARLAATDSLTGIANRRTLVERLDRDVARSAREDSPLSCIMTDIDHFKQVNDTYGHATGDNVIRAVAHILTGLCRPYDTVGRFGGEEFVMVLPGMDTRAAARVAERARLAVLALALGDRLPVSHLSASFGVSCLDIGVQDGASLISEADKALYAAKRAGRNRVVTHVDTDVTVRAPDLERPAADPVRYPAKDMTQARIIELETRIADYERDLERRQEFDTLTGVPTRTLFLQRVATELVRSQRHGTLVGVLSFELRDLPRIATTFGHEASDALVVAFVERLHAALRATDAVSVIVGTHSLSRVTSNEYGVLLSELGDTAGALVVVTRLRRLLSEPFLLEGERVYVGANIGIALSGAGQQDAVRLYGQAGEARIDASAKPDKVSHGFASTSLDERADDYIRLEADLHEAIESGGLQTWFQPKFDLAARRVTGMEALLRWPHPSRGFVSPEVFVAVAEANGMIGQLSTLVLHQTLSQIKLWNAMGFDELRVSINLSPMQLRTESLVPDMLDALSRAGVPGRQLEVELTETSVLNNPDEACAALVALRDAGITVSMDDFGTGYTSLSLLARLPLDTVKIDRSFVVAMADGERPVAMIESIIKMARALGLRVVGEGVETNEELEVLARMGCDEIQGYLISRPGPPDEISAFLVRQQAAGLRRRA